MEPAESTFVDHAAHVVSTEVDIAVSVEDIWGALVDNARWTEWFDCSRCVASPQVWSAAGDTRTIKVGLLSIDEVAVDLEAPNRWSITFTAANVALWVKAFETVELFDTSRQGETRTEIRWTGAFEFTMFARPFASVLMSRTARTWGQGFENLALYLASQR